MLILQQDDGKLMKTREQILRYISQCGFQGDDWQKVLDYCRQRFGGGKAHKSPDLSPRSMSTYDEFIEWIDNGIGVGDVVRYGHTVGIIGAYTPNYAKLSAYLSFDGELIDNDMEIVKSKIYKATDEDKSLMKQKMVAKGLEFSVPLSRCIKAYQPKGGDVVSIANGDIQTTGIFRAKDEEHNYFYVYIDGDKVVKDMTCEVGSVVMSPPTKGEYRHFLAVLTKNNLEWNPRQCVLRLIEATRAPKGKKYWYINDRFRICADIDKYTKLHDERHKQGNYFVSYQSAVLFCRRMCELRKEMAETV